MSWSEWMVILEKCRIPPGCALTTALDTGAQGSSASPFLKKKQQKKKFAEKYLVGCRCFVSLIHRGQLEFCQRE